MEVISMYATPCFIFLFLMFGLVKRVDVYDSFVSGAKSGLEATFNIIPSLIGLMAAIAMFRESGCLELIAKALSLLTNLIHMPSEVVPLGLLRPVSGSASLALVTDIFKNMGPETTFYTIAVYFGSVGIKNIRYTLFAALAADACGILLSTALVQAFGM